MNPRLKATAHRRTVLPRLTFIGVWISRLGRDFSPRLALALGLLLVTTLFGSPAKAQDREPAEVSGLAILGVEFTRDAYSLGYAQRLTTTDGFDGVRLWQHVLTAHFDASPLLKVGGGYRLTLAPEAEEFCCRHRVHAEAEFRFRDDALRGSLRTRAQLSTSPGDEPKFTLRQRAKGSYAFLSEVRAFLSVEGFLPLTPSPSWGLRVDVGTDLRPADWVTIDVFYRFELAESPDPMDHIIGLETVFEVGL